jgi:hypothetical protein
VIVTPSLGISSLSFWGVLMSNDATKGSVKTTIVTTVLTVIITAVLTVIGTWIKQQWIDPFSFTVRVAYLDPQGNHIDLPDADVVPDINNLEGKKTNVYGEAIFSNVEPHPFQKATITVRHSGFVYSSGTQAPTIPIRKRDDAISVMLRPVGSGSVEPSGGTRTNESLINPRAVTSVCRSGPMPSGIGRDFSQPYSLCSDSPSCSPAPPRQGYVIESEHFELTGDRRCNAWSNCQREASSTNTRVCYQFQMQGHSEWQGPFGLGGSGVAYSEGILTVLWGRH